MAWQQKFSHIYIEKEALDYEITKEIIRKEPEATQILIDHHKDVFSPSSSRFSLQKTNPKLILAVKKGKFLYQGNERINSWNQSKLYYSDQIRNCLFDCSYCFLQGMHNSAHILIFVNMEDYLEELKTLAEKDNPYLSISYLTDILAFEELFPFSRTWIEEVEKHQGLTMEIRSKTDFFRALHGITPPKQTVLVWSLSNDRIARSKEKGTAHFRNRLIAAKQALDAGWRVKICFDPIVIYEGWEEDTQKMINETFRWLNATLLEEVSIGSFRISQQYFRHFSKTNKSQYLDDQRLVPDLTNREGLVSYSENTRKSIFKTLKSKLLEHIDPEKIFWVEG
jgi:spore photoproduct lyase